MTTVSPPAVVLVTGVARYLGAHLAARLAADHRIDRVVGVDANDPGPRLRQVLDGVELHRIDPRTAEVADLLADTRAEVVAHLAVATGSDPADGGRQLTKERNVIGTLQLLAACQRAPRLRGIVVRSSTAAYGASFRDPAVFTEETEPQALPRGGYARDVLDIEGYVRSFRRRCPEVWTTVLRFAPFVGPYADTGLTRYFARPVVPSVLGRDPRLQFVHVDDAFEVLHRSVAESHPGTFNVAGRGVITLSQAIRRAGRVAAPVLEPGYDAARLFSRSTGSAGFSLDRLDLFVHGRVVDTTRLVRDFGFEPRPTVAAFDDFVVARRDGALLAPETLRSVERRMLDHIRRARHGAAAVGGGQDD